MVDRVNEVAIPAHFGGVLGKLSGAWVFANRGGEIRNYLRIVDGGLVLTNVERAETVEQLVFSTPSLSDMEKFLTYYFCDSLREDRRLPRLLVVSIPVTIDKAADGYTVVETEGIGYELHRRGESVVRRGSDTDLVEFSHYVALTPEEIRASALDPEGKPHFMVDTRT
ncbi:Imm61 family immunity protein [Leifsonia sp. WHRI 6310E]|uniref:Imm61 family immunity protein n=1 Tax=Leifsonia sp. WHRI 6310E TaxID=3162562 RepID=UPI0035A95535